MERKHKPEPTRAQFQGAELLSVTAAPRSDIPASPTSCGVRPGLTTAWTRNDPIKCFLFGPPHGLWTELMELGGAAEFLSSSPADSGSVLPRVVDGRPEMSPSPTCFWAPFLFMGVYHTSRCYKTPRSGCMTFSPGTGREAESWVCGETSAGLVFLLLLWHAVSFYCILNVCMVFAWR